MLPVRLFRKPPRLPHPLMGGHRLWQMRKVGQQRARIVRRREKGRRGERREKGHVAPGAELQLPQLHNRGPGWAGAGHAP